MRGLQRLGILAALALLMLGVAGGVWSYQASAKADPDRALSTEAAEQAAALDDYFDRSAAIGLLTAHDSAFAEFYAAPGSRRSKIRDDVTLMARVNGVLAFLGKLFPGRVEEACFIDGDGAENARVVRGFAAFPPELSPDETHNPFYAPTLALGPGRVYQARPYQSPDTHQWVVSNSTLLPSSRATAMVHFEVSLDSFREVIISSNPKLTSRIVDARTGAVLLDSRYPLRPGDALGRPNDHSLAGLTRHLRTADAMTLGGTRLAYQRVPRRVGNANDWVIVVSTPVAVSTAARLLTIGTAAPLVAGVVLLIVLGASFRASQRQLRLTAHRDTVTGLPNRAYLQLRMAEALERSGPAKTLVGLLLIDLDGFKEVNDTLGHHYGDLLLGIVGQRLSSEVGGHGTVARLGGDEFAVLFPDVRDRAHAESEAARLAVVLNGPCELAGITLEVQASIGMAVFPEDAKTSGDLLQRADIAMYAAKQAHAAVVAFNPDLDQHSRRQLALLGELRSAIERSQLVVHYQPKAELTTGRIYGVEALVRWQHPEHGLIQPGEFMPQVERTELIRPLTRYVLQAALEQARAWQAEGHDLTVAVNIGARNLLDATFPEEVSALLADAEVPADHLVLEITESTIMADPVRSEEVLTRLCLLGVRVAIDDFGTGFSSMAHLRDLTIHELKIDRSFISHMCHRPNDAVIVRSTIALARSLGLNVVAEGVEDQLTWDELERLRCHAAQGYFLSKPIAAADLGRLLSGRTIPSPR